MSRRSRRYARAWVDWKPDFAKLFGAFEALVSGLEPPTRVRVYHGDRHLTVVGRFTDPAEMGRHVTVKARVAKS